jgi:hypothetical protein
MGRKALDAVGETFGTLKVMRRAEGPSAHSSYWDCVCLNCSNWSVVSARSLQQHKRTGKSCRHCKMTKREYPLKDFKCRGCGSPVQAPSNRYSVVCSQACREVRSRSTWTRNRYKTFDAFLKALYSQVKLRAFRKGWKFDLPEGYLLEMYQKQEGRCARTGVPFTLHTSVSRTRAGGTIPSVDRIDPTGGYTTDNVELVTYAMNTCRNAFTHEEYTQMCVQYLQHQGFICTPKEGRSP